MPPKLEELSMDGKQYVQIKGPLGVHFQFGKDWNDVSGAIPGWSLAPSWVSSVWVHIMEDISNWEANEN